MGSEQSKETVVASGETASRFRRSMSWVRSGCLPSFGAACAISLGVLLACVMWTLSDAWFRMTAQHVCWSIMAGSFSEVFLIRELVPRIAVLLVLSSLGLWSSCVVALRLFAGKRGGRSVRSWIVAVALCAAWLSLWASWDGLNWLGLRLRVRAALPRFEVTVASIEIDSHVSSAARSSTDEYDGCWFTSPILDTGFSRREGLGWIYCRSDNDTLHLQLKSARDCFVVYCPSGRVPASFDGGPYGSVFTLRKAVRLKDSWYLVSYE